MVQWGYKLDELKFTPGHHFPTPLMYNMNASSPTSLGSYNPPLVLLKGCMPPCSPQASQMVSQLT